MSLVIKRVKEISRKKKKSSWRSRRQQQQLLLQEQLEKGAETPPDKEEQEEQEEEAVCVAVPPPHHKRPLVEATERREELTNKRRCRPCRSCRGRVNTTNQFEFIEPAPKNYLKHLHLFAIAEGGPGGRIVFYKKDRVEGPCCGAPGGRCDRYRPQAAQEFYAPAVEDVNAAAPRGFERVSRTGFVYRFSNPEPPPPPPPLPQFIWTKYGPDNRLSMIYLCNRYDPYLADSKWRRKYREQMTLLRHRNYLAGNRGGFVQPPYN